MTWSADIRVRNRARSKKNTRNRYETFGHMHESFVKRFMPKASGKTLRGNPRSVSQPAINHFERQDSVSRDQGRIFFPPPAMLFVDP
jgi:hypothetical protein